MRKNHPCVEYLQPPSRGVSVIIPCKNEEKAIRTTIVEVKNVLNRSKITHEIIVVDDGSTDNTQIEAITAGARILEHPINMGYGNSIMDGMQVAKYDLIAILDGDGTYPVHMLPSMIAEVSAHDLVIGTRTWTKLNTSFRGRIFRRLLYYLLLYLTNTKASDYNSGFRVFRKLNLLNYRQLLCPTFSFTTSQTLLYLLTARSVCFMPIQYAPRIGRSKVSYFRDAFKTFSYVFLMANVFQAYRLCLIFIAVGLFLNVLVLLCSRLLLLQFALQLGLHITVSLVLLQCLAAMGVQMVAKLVSHKLGQQTGNVRSGSIPVRSEEAA